MAWEMPGLGSAPWTIDCHAHLIPPHWYPGEQRPRFRDLDALFRQRDAAVVHLTVFGNSGFFRPLDRSLAEIAREYNDFAAELTARHPDRLLGLAWTDPFDGEPSLRERERAVGQGGVRGVVVNTSTDGEYWE